MRASWMRGVWVVLAGLGLTLVGCGDGAQTTVKCYTDEQCPTGQQCVGGYCQLPADDGPRICTTTNDCPIGQWCDNGLCVAIPDEPPVDAADGGEDGGGGDGDLPAGDDGGAGDPGGPDEDLRDYSALNFTVAMARGGTSGPAGQCVNGIHPVANSGPQLPPVTVVAGFTVSGQVRDSGGGALPGARVKVLAEREACVPAPVTADGSGNYTFYLPAGTTADLQAIAADGRVGYGRVTNLQSNQSLNISLPATEALAGGPLVILDNQSNEVPQDGWTVQAYYRSGTLTGRLAHNGVVSGPPAATGEFSLPLEVGPGYDLLGYGPASSALPFQILYEDVCQASGSCANKFLGAHTLRDGSALSGRVTIQGGAGAPGSILSLMHDSDPRLVQNLSAGTDGNYQTNVRPGTWNLTVRPSAAAFQQAAALFASPGLSLWQALVKDITLQVAEGVEFTGQLMDPGGAPVSGVQVRLLLNDTPMQEGAYSHCDENPATTDAQGTFRLRCNLLP